MYAPQLEELVFRFHIPSAWYSETQKTAFLNAMLIYYKSSPLKIPQLGEDIQAGGWPQRHPETTIAQQG